MRGVLALVAATCLIVVAPECAFGATESRARHASAVVRDAAGSVLGTARFVEDARGVVHVNVHVRGLTPGLHGIHVHAIGACTPSFLAAGGHHNPTGEEHGLENPNGPHAGDLPNLVVNGAGVGRLSAKTTRLTLSPSPTTIFDANGSSVVIHERTDDQVTDPTGNSGGRVACGVISPR